MRFSSYFPPGDRKEETEEETRRPQSSFCYSPEDVDEIYRLEVGGGGDDEVEKLLLGTEEKIEGGKLVQDLSQLDDGVAGRIIFKNGSSIFSPEFEAGFPAAGSELRLVTSDAQTLIIGKASRFNPGCFEGIVRAYDRSSPSRNLIYAAFVDPVTAKTEGPRWFRRLSVFDENLVGMFYSETPAVIDRESGPLKEFSGDRIAFIYPDFSTSLIGSFHLGRMINAKEAELSSADFSSSDLPRVEFRETENEAVFKKEESTRTWMTSRPLLADPYESKLVEVRQSSIPKAGQGVFLKRSVAAETVVSYFNGVRLKEADIFNGPVKKKSVYLVEIGEEDDYLDVPKEMTDWDNYRASAGHKVNHDKLANSGYTECEHPRFGRILCLRTLRALEAGQELFTQYDVAFDKQGMKNLLKTALNLGHLFSGKSKSEFVKDVRPYLEAASKMAENIKIEDFVRF